MATYKKENNQLIETITTPKSNQYTREDVEKTVANLQERINKLNIIRAEMVKLGL